MNCVLARDGGSDADSLCWMELYLFIILHTGSMNYRWISMRIIQNADGRNRRQLEAVNQNLLKILQLNLPEKILHCGNADPLVKKR